jgi:hypothetical protein
VKDYLPKAVIVDGHYCETIKKARDYMNARLSRELQIPQWKIYYALSCGKKALSGFALDYADHERREWEPKPEPPHIAGRDSLMARPCTSRLGYNSSRYE